MEMNVLKSQAQFKVIVRQGGGVNTAEIVKPVQIFESFISHEIPNSDSNY